MTRGFVYNFSMQVKILCSGACQQVASTNRVYCSFSVEKRYLSVDLSTNCLVIDNRIVEASFPEAIRQKAVNCLVNDKILSFV